MRVLILLNAAAGTLLASRQNNEADLIRDRFAHHGIDAEVRGVPGAELKDTTIAARDSGAFDLIIAGGGDGTINTVAGALVGSSVEFSVLPLGTFNHLAKELGLPLDLAAAIDALATGRAEPFNVGQVNGQTFLLFGAIGLYSDMVRHRDAQRKTLGRSKMLAGTIAFFKMLFRWPLMRVTLREMTPSTGLASITRLTSTVYVSLSGYQMTQMGVLNAPADARETLSVLISPQVSRLGLMWVIMKGMVGRVMTGRDLQQIRCETLTIETHGRATVRVGYDGEVQTMTSPLRFELVRGGLMMRRPGTVAADGRG